MQERCPEQTCFPQRWKFYAKIHPKASFLHHRPVTWGPCWSLADVGMKAVLGVLRFLPATSLSSYLIETLVFSST